MTDPEIIADLYRKLAESDTALKALHARFVILHKEHEEWMEEIGDTYEAVGQHRGRHPLNLADVVKEVLGK